MAQLKWTYDVNRAMEECTTAQNQKAMIKCKQNYKKRVENYVELIEKPDISKLNRVKLVNLIIVDQHHREIIEKLVQKKITSRVDFEWLKQLRFTKFNEENNGQLEV